MSKQLYEEAIADLKKVKEIAEDNAKRAVVEAVAPRIRELIEKELLGESMEEEAHAHSDKKDIDDKQILTDEPAGDEPVKTDSVDESHVESVSFAEIATEAASNAGELEQKLLYVEETLNKLSNVTESSELDSTLLQVNETIDAIYDYVNENVENPTAKLGYGLKLRKYLEQLEKLQETKMKSNLLNEEDVTIELTGLPDDVDLESLGVNLISKAGGEESEESSEEAGTEMSKDEEELDLDLGGEEGETEEASEESEEESEETMEAAKLDDEAVVEIDESMLRQEIANMKALRETKDNEVGAMGHGAGDVSDEFEEEDMGDALELELSEAMAEMGYEADVHGMKEEEEEDSEEEESTDEMVHTETEMDEVADNKEGYGMAGQASELEDYTPEGVMPLEGMDEMDEEMHEKKDEEKEEDEKNEVYGQAYDVASTNVSVAQPSKQARQPGMSTESVRQEMAKELELQESLRKRASQLKKLYEASKKSTTTAKTLVERKQAAAKGDEVKAAYVVTANRYNDSVTRFNKLSQSLSEGAVKGDRSNSDAKSGASADQIDMLSKKLAETNLFNAKLLFTNKLLQSESLTARQKAQIIEQLDSAETIREAKLVYESLAKALVKPRKTVSEGRVIGSSSQATRPASTQTLAEGVESERWAKLAGIK